MPMVLALWRLKQENLDFRAAWVTRGGEGRSRRVGVGKSSMLWPLSYDTEVR